MQAAVPGCGRGAPRHGPQARCPVFQLTVGADPAQSPSLVTVTLLTGGGA